MRRFSRGENYLRVKSTEMRGIYGVASCRIPQIRPWNVEFLAEDLSLMSYED
jgi:hypothetical protein